MVPQTQDVAWAPHLIKSSYWESLTLVWLLISFVYFRRRRKGLSFLDIMEIYIVNCWLSGICSCLCPESWNECSHCLYGQPDSYTGMQRPWMESLFAHPSTLNNRMPIGCGFPPSPPPMVGSAHPLGFLLFKVDGWANINGFHSGPLSIHSFLEFEFWLHLPEPIGYIYFGRCNWYILYCFWMLQICRPLSMDLLYGTTGEYP